MSDGQIHFYIYLHILNIQWQILSVTRRQFSCSIDRKTMTALYLSLFILARAADTIEAHQAVLHQMAIQIGTST